MTEPEVRVDETGHSGRLAGTEGTGDPGGHVVAGAHALRIGSPHGGIATALAADEKPQPQLVEPPLNLHPISLVDQLGREAEIGTGIETLRARRPFEVHGEAGSGRTTLLVDLLARIPGEDHGNRVVYASARHQTVADLLQLLFECFYRCDVLYKPTDAQLRRYLGTVDALVTLDDTQLSREELQQLMLEAPRCTLALATGQRTLWDGRSLALGGLPDEAALALLQQALGRADRRDWPIAPEDREAALAVCRRLGGHPLSLLQAAADAAGSGLTLPELAARMGPGASHDAPDRAVERMKSLTEPQRSVMGLLAAVDGGPLGVELVQSSTGIEDATAVLGTLRRRGLVRTDGASWTLTGPMAPALEDALGAGGWRPVVAQRLADWAARRGRQPEQVAEERTAIVASLAWAERSRRWQDVLRIAGVVEGPLALARAWGLWRSVLEAALSAARETGDRPAEARALHQLGTRALCLDDRPEARRRLSDALHIRESLGDDAGAGVTRGNIELLELPPSRRAGSAPPSTATPSPRRSSTSFVRAGIGALGALVLAALAWAGWWALRPPGPPTDVVVDRASVPFAEQPVGTVSEPMQVRLTNRGAGRLPIDRVDLRGTDEHDFVAEEHGCTGTPLDPDQTCTVEVRFAPQAVGGRRASVVVVSHGSDVSSVTLAGTGVASTATGRDDPRDVGQLSAMTYTSESQRLP